jgi:hypothetical protein
MARHVVVALWLLALLLPAGAHAEGPVSIGVLRPYTGVLSIQGQDAARGLELDLAKLGNRIGGREVQVLGEDSAVRPDVGFTTMVKARRGPIDVMRVAKQGGRLVNAVVDRIPAVSQEATWTWWKK